MPKALGSGALRVTRVRVYATRLGVELVLVSLCVIVAGVVQLSAPIVSWGGGLLLGLLIARGLSFLHVLRVRTSGLEMVWAEPQRSAQATRGEAIELSAELRNRDGRAVRVEGLNVLSSPALSVAVSPLRGEIPGGAALALRLRVLPPRVGRHGLFGLNLQLCGSAGLFQIPLSFSNPFGVEVLPDSRGPAGSRSRNRAQSATEELLAGRRPGDSNEVRELRDHRPGDPFKRVAWKASARRGRLLVREYESFEQQRVWLVVNASSELALGEPGWAPLDQALDAAARLGTRALEAGHVVGVAVVTGARVQWLDPQGGRGQARRIREFLASATCLLAPQRSGLDNAQVAARVFEHLSTCWPQMAEGIGSRDTALLSERARAAQRMAPFPTVSLPGASGAEATLRSYLAAFGIGAPARLEPEGPASNASMVECLTQLSKARRGPSALCVIAPIPDTLALTATGPAFRALGRRRVQSEWLWLPALDSAVGGGPSAAFDLLRAANQMRAAVTRQQARRVLARFGVGLRPCQAEQRSERARA